MPDPTAGDRTAPPGALAATPRRPKRIVPRTLAFGAATLAMACALTLAPAVATAWNQGSAEATLWQLLNGARANNGLAPLQQHGTLISLARWRSQDMLNRNYFSHTIAGCGCDVYRYYDSNGVAWSWAGENIGWNAGHSDADSPVSVHNGFMSSPGHRANVLDPRFTYGGLGAAAKDGLNFLGYGVMNVRMYTELFLQPRVSAPAPPPPSGGGGSGGGGTGGGGSGDGGTAAARPAPTAPPAPEPSEMAVDAPSRPVSSAGLDGVAVAVEPRAARPVAHVARIAIDEIEDASAGRTTGAPNAPGDVLTRAPGEVSPPAASTGPLDGILTALFGFLFN